MACSEDRVWAKLSAEEIRLANVWHHDDGKKPCEIATLLHRDKSSIIRMFVLKRERRQDRRPKAFTEAHVESRDPQMITLPRRDYQIQLSLRPVVAHPVLLRFLFGRNHYSQMLQKTKEKRQNMKM